MKNHPEIQFPKASKQSKKVEPLTQQVYEISHNGGFEAQGLSWQFEWGAPCEGIELRLANSCHWDLNQTPSCTSSSHLSASYNPISARPRSSSLRMSMPHKLS